MYIEKIVKEIIYEYAKTNKNIDSEELFERVFQDESIQKPNYDKFIKNEVGFDNHLLDTWGVVFEMCYNLYFLCNDSAKWLNKNRQIIKEENKDLLNTINAQITVWNRVIYMYNAILVLSMKGMVDASYQLCRTLYELCIISELIGMDSSSANNFINTKGKDIKDYSWTLDYINRCRVSKKHKPIKKATFAELEKYVVKDSTLYNKRNANYKGMCSFVHATPDFLWNTYGMYGGIPSENSGTPLKSDVNIDVALRHAVYILNLVTLQLIQAHIGCEFGDKAIELPVVMFSVSEYGDIVLKEIQDYGEAIREEIDKKGSNQNNGQR